MDRRVSGTGSEERHVESEDIRRLAGDVAMLVADKAVREVIARNGYHWDASRYEEFVAQFTEREAAETMVEAVGRGPVGHGDRIHLHGSNLVTRIDGDDAVARTYFMSFVRRQGDDDAFEVVLENVGSIRWKLRRIDGEWRIEERALTRFSSSEFPHCLAEAGT